MVMTAAAAQPVRVRSISCPNCGGPVQIRGFAHTLSAVCQQCMSVLDTSTPEVRILQTFQARERVQPMIPLGTRGTLRGTQYEVIGFQVREVQTGDSWSWNEYLLFNPWKGFRYLTEYNGHWNFVTAAKALPENSGYGGKLAMRFEGRNYILFDQMTARTAYVLGEFPWRVRVGESAACKDFVSPPYMLSSESTSGEITWSRAEYMPGREIWKAFKLGGSPPLTYSIFANQPSPYRGTRDAWRIWFWLNVALAVLAIAFMIIAPGRVAFREQYELVRGLRTEPAFVTPPFPLTGRESNVQIAIHTDLNNSWAYFNFSLINRQTGQAFDFGREVSYYGDEGSPNNSVIIPSVPSGQYYLRVEPELDPGTRLMHYDLTLRRDVANYAFFVVAAVLLLIPPVVKTFRSVSFEAARWRESDFAPSGSILKSGGGD
jgi:hypothetical protein